MKRTTAVETNIYFAKATQPANMGWRSQWMTRHDAINAAKFYVQTWLDNGLSQAEACVFYRDGSISEVISAKSL